MFRAATLTRSEPSLDDDDDDLSVSGGSPGTSLSAHLAKNAIISDPHHHHHHHHHGGHHSHPTSVVLPLPHVGSDTGTTDADADGHDYDADSEEDNDTTSIDAPKHVFEMI